MTSRMRQIMGRWAQSRRSALDDACRVVRDATGAETRQEAEQRLLAQLRRSTATSQGGPLDLLKGVAGRLGIDARPHTPAFAIAGVWSDLSPAGRRAMAAAIPGDLAAVCPVLASSADAGTRQQAAAILGSVVGRITPGLVSGLALDEDPAVRASLADSLGEAVQRAAATSSHRRDTDGLDSVLAAIARVAPDVDQPALLETVLARLALPCPAGVASSLVDAITAPTEPAAMVLRGVLRRVERLSGLDLVRLMRHESLAPGALDALQALVRGPGLIQAASAAHLLRTPTRRARVRRARRSAALWPSPTTLGCDQASAEPADALNTIRWCGVMGLWDGAGAEALIDRVLTCPSPAARWLAAWQWSQPGRRPGAPASAALRDLMFDADGRVARTALLARAANGRTTPVEWLRPIARSPHPVCRSIARATLERCDPLAWVGSAGPTRGRDAVAARAALARDRGWVVGRLRNMITTGSTPVRIRSIGLAVRLNIACDIELELLTAASDGEPRVAATAIAALGRVGTESAQQALVACLSHPDARARANALEALARTGAGLDAARERLASDAARERGNAVWALARGADSTDRQTAVETVSALLTDERPGHRLAGLWVAGRLGRVEAATRVARLVAPDEPEPVRLRARRTARRLLALMRESATV